MSTRNVGVFLNAEHLLAARAQLRTPQALTERVDAATAQLMSAGEVSHRVVVGDCSEKATRKLADRLALDEGYCVRHRPTHQTASELVASEIIEAALHPGGLVRVVIVGDDPAEYSALVPALQRLGTWVVFLHTAGKNARLGDLSYALDLSPQPLVASLAQAEAAAQQEGREATPEEFEKALRAEIPGFRPTFYGHKTMQGLVDELRARATESKDTTGDRGTRESGRRSGSTAVPLSAADRTLARVTVGALSGTRWQTTPPQTVDEHIELLSSVLGALADDPEARPLFAGRGVALSEILKAVRGSVPDWALAGRTSATALFQRAVRPGWTVDQDAETARVMVSAPEPEPTEPSATRPGAVEPGAPALDAAEPKAPEPQAPESDGAPAAARVEPVVVEPVVVRPLGAEPIAAPPEANGGQRWFAVIDEPSATVAEPGAAGRTAAGAAPRGWTDPVTSRAAPVSGHAESEVLVVDGHPDFHRGSCTCLDNDRAVPLPRTEAQRLGFRACPWCGPL